MYDTPSLVSIGLWRSQWLQNDYWVMAKSWTIPTIPQGLASERWLHEVPLQGSNKLSQDVTKHDANAPERSPPQGPRTPVPGLQWLQSQNTGSCIGLPIFCDVYIFEKLDPNVSTCESNIICKWTHHQSWETTSPWPHQDVMSDECVLCI